MSSSSSMPSVGLARLLRDAGLPWDPRNGDHFHIPDRDFGEEVWMVSDMSIEPRRSVGQENELAFNGTVEWALDSIVKDEVVWVPTEGQLRELLGEHFIALLREDDGSYACVIRLRQESTTFTGATAAESYAEALLATLGEPR